MGRGQGSNLPAEEVGHLMGEAEFREMIGGWAEILDMQPEARKQRLERLAHMIIEQKMAEGCPRTAVLVQRTYARKRDPVVQLAKGFAQLCEMDRARAERFPQSPEDPEPPVSPLQAVVDQAKAAAAMRGPAHPDDAAIWRQAGALRREMFGEQVLFAAVSDVAEVWRQPLELWEVDAIEAAQVAAFAARQAAEKAEAEKVAETVASAPPPEPEPTEPPPIETDESFAARAMAMFEQTLAQAPPHIREVLETFTPEQRLELIARSWPEGGEGFETLRGPKAAQGP